MEFLTCVNEIDGRLMTIRMCCVTCHCHICLLTWYLFKQTIRSGDWSFPCASRNIDLNFKIDAQTSSCIQKPFFGLIIFLCCSRCLAELYKNNPDFPQTTKNISSLTISVCCVSCLPASHHCTSALGRAPTTRHLNTLSTPPVMWGPGSTNSTETGVTGRHRRRWRINELDRNDLLLQGVSVHQPIKKVNWKDKLK